MIFALKKNALSIALVFWIAFCVGISPTSLSAKIPDRPHGDLPSEYWQFWFLYESEKRPGQNFRFFRPFYSSFQEHETAYSQTTVLFPIFYRERTEYWTTWTVMFLFTGTRFLHEDTGEDNDILTPLFLYGYGQTETDRYIGFFPFYGTAKGKLGYQSIDFLLFPLYARWERKNYRAHGVLWPVIMWGSSEKRKDFRIFPFYSHKEHQGKYRQTSVLWPFFQWGSKFLNKREPVHYGMFFPFYMFKDSEFGNMRSRGILWFPFLGSFLGYGYDERRAEVDFNALFFLFQYGKNNDMDYRKFILFPFYGQYQFASKRSIFVTPFYFYLGSDTHHVRSHYNFLLPFFSHMTQYYPEQDRTDRYWKLWPLVRYHRDTEGSVVWNALTLFPIRSDELEKTWDPVVSLVEYKTLSNGEKQFSLLLRLYTQRWSEDRISVFIPFLTDFETSPHRTEWKFFYGLLGVKKENENRTYQFLWFLQI